MPLLMKCMTVIFTITMLMNRNTNPPLGGRLNNNVLIFERGHPFLVDCLNQMFERFVLNTSL